MQCGTSQGHASPASQHTHSWLRGVVQPLQRQCRAPARVRIHSGYFFALIIHEQVEVVLLAPVTVDRIVLLLRVLWHFMCGAIDFQQTQPRLRVERRVQQPWRRARICATSV